MKKEHRQKAVPWVLLIAMIAAVLLSVNCGYSRIPYSDVIASLLNPGDPNASVILLQIRLPRIVLAVLCGMGLALSGCVLQAVTENPLADPGILGINAGAGFTVMLFLTLFPALHTSTMIYQPLFAMAGGLLAAVLLYVFQKEREGQAGLPLARRYWLYRTGRPTYSQKICRRTASFASSRIHAVWRAAASACGYHRAFPFWPHRNTGRNRNFRPGCALFSHSASQADIRR